MAKIFNITGCCIPEEHYMVDLSSRLESMKALIASRQYFTINRARQYGKTTTLVALEQYLKKSYYVVLLDFQLFGAGEFENENIFALSFARSFLRALKGNNGIQADILDSLQKIVQNEPASFRLQRLFEQFLRKALCNIDNMECDC